MIVGAAQRRATLGVRVENVRISAAADDGARYVSPIVAKLAMTLGVGVRNLCDERADRRLEERNIDVDRLLPSARRRNVHRSSSKSTPVANSGRPCVSRMKRVHSGLK